MERSIRGLTTAVMLLGVCVILESAVVNRLWCRVERLELDMSSLAEVGALTAQAGLLLAEEMRELKQGSPPDPVPVWSGRELEWGIWFNGSFCGVTDLGSECVWPEMESERTIWLDDVLFRIGEDGEWSVGFQVEL